MRTRRTEDLRRPFAIIGILAAAVLLSGCASFHMLPVNALEPRAPLPYASALVEVVPAVADEVDKEVTDLELATVDRLRKLDGFESVELEHPEAQHENALLIRMTMSNIRKVSGTTRFFLGAFAGKASVNVTVEFFEASTMEPVGKYEITGKSGGSGFSGGTSEAVRKTADAVAKLVAETYSLSVTKSTKSE